ncbi:UNVERIFIED_CONTAM: Cytosolic sulfotransferase 8, partial [Sesamum radiatum]
MPMDRTKAVDKDRSWSRVPILCRQSNVGVLQTLEQVTWDGLPLVKYCGCWVPVITFRTILAAQKHFKAKDTDIILSTMPKSGTTWLKALTFSIANRNAFPIDQSPLLTSTPHMLVPFLDLNVYWEQDNPDLENIPNQEFSPRTCISTCFLFPSMKATVELSTSAETLWISLFRTSISRLKTILEKVRTRLPYMRLSTCIARELTPMVRGYWNAHFGESRESVVSPVRRSERGYHIS